MEQEFREITPSLLEKAKKNARSVESMEGYGAGGHKPDYTGSEISGYLDNDERKGQKIFDYYEDSAGAYWYKVRALLPDGRIVSMEAYLFGKEEKEMRRIKRKVNKKEVAVHEKKAG